MFIGHTRFSLFMPASKSWRIARGDRFPTEEAYRDHLFSDERLEPRVKLFLERSLPQIAQAAEGYEVAHVVSYSDTLPEKYQAQLEAAAVTYPFLILDKVERNGKQLDRSHVARRLTPKGKEQLFATYRLDDDDILGINFFEQLETYTRPACVRRHDN